MIELFLIDHQSDNTQVYAVYTGLCVRTLSLDETAGLNLQFIEKIFSADPIFYHLNCVIIDTVHIFIAIIYDFKLYITDEDLLINLPNPV